MTRVADESELLQRHWGMGEALLSQLEGGMNSATWLVECEGARYVLKRVPASGLADLLAGCEAASTFAQAGLVTGAPVPTLDGRMVASEHGLALLVHVPGRELDGESDEEQRWIAATLARVHLAANAARGPSPATFMADWLSPRLPGTEAHPWLGPVFEAVRAETDPLTLTWSLLHTDPTPEAFIHDDRTGVTGLIDWTGAQRGPVLYDVASAVMYLRGPERASAFLGAYEEQGPLGADETRSLDAFRRFRWAVQAAYFAQRLATHDLTGIADQAENEQGLARARRGLSELGLDTR